MRSSRLARLGLLALGLAACNAIAGLDGDFSVDGGAALDASGSSSASSSGASSSGSSGSTTSSSSSSGAPLDAAPDATATSDGAADASSDASPADAGADVTLPARFCPVLGALWCDDFEDAVGPSPFGWTGETLVPGGGSLTLVTGGHLAGTKTLRARLTDPTTTNDRSAYLFRTVNGSPLATAGSTATLDFDFLVSSANAEYVVLGALRVGSSRREYGLALYTTGCSGGGACLDETEPTDDPHVYTGARRITFGTWHHATVFLARTSGNYAGKVTLDGVNDVHDVTSGALLDSPAPSIVEVAVGAFYSYPNSGQADVRIDNVTVKLSP